MDTTQVGFTFGGADLTDNEMDWFGFHTQGLIVALYTQFNAADILVQNGHATWRQAAAPPRRRVAVHLGHGLRRFVAHGNPGGRTTL